MPTIALSLNLDEALHQRIQHLAQTQNRTAHAMLHTAIENYLEREEKRQAFQQDALEAWEEYQRTGLHLTGEEVDAWLARLQAGEDAPLPPCHR